MSREEFIGKLQMVYVGDRNAFNDIVCAYDSLLCRKEKASEIIKKEKEIMGYAKYDSCLLLIENILQNGSDDNE